MHTSLKRTNVPGLIGAVAFAVVVAPLNSTMLFVALVPIREDFGVGTAAATWLISAYFIAMAVMQPMGGRLGDQLGRRKVFLGGAVAFAIVSALAMVAWSFPVLIIFRVAQAISGGLMFPNGMALLREEIPAHQRGKAFGAMGALIGIAVGAGPLLGGVLATAFHWRVLFATNLPLIAIALILAIRYLPTDRPASESSMKPDLLGATWLLASLTFLGLTGSLFGARDTASVAWPVSVAALAVVAGVFFVLRQRRAPNPLVDFTLFRVRAFAAGTVSSVLSNIVMFSVLIAVPLYVLDLRGGTEAQAGLLLGVMAVFSIGLAPAAGVIMDRVGRRKPALAGGLVLLIGASMANGVGENTPWLLIVIALWVMGTGSAFLQSSLQTASIEALPREQAGAASGIFATTRHVGGLLATAMVAALVGSGGLDSIVPIRLLAAILTVVSLGTMLVAFGLHHWPPDMGRSSEGQPSTQEVEVG
jgi:DHA2 family methylenomycin A resistance protein-like MFS transporter